LKPTFRDNILVLCLKIKMGPMDCPESSTTNYLTPRIKNEDGRIQFSCIEISIVYFFCTTLHTVCLPDLDCILCVLCCVFYVVLFFYVMVQFYVLLYSSVLLCCSLLLILLCSSSCYVQGCIKKFRDWTYRLECIYLI
jgi:hypothetical protein